MIDETSCRKWGSHTPGVRRQYLGCVGKVDHGIVTVHIGVARGRFQALLDTDLFLPKSWDEDRERCRAADIPDHVHHQRKWRIAFNQLAELRGHGMHFDWLVFDAGYGAAVPFLRLLNVAGQRFVAEVPKHLSVRPSIRADERLDTAHAEKGRLYRLRHQTVADSFWRASQCIVWVANRRHRLVVIFNEATKEKKYLLTNAMDQSLKRVLAVAFRRWTIEHSFRLAKQEAGLMHYEGRSYLGLRRHMVLSLVVLGFVALHT